AEIGDTRRHHLVDRLRYYVLLVGKLPEILDIVDDNLGAGVLERDDVACEAGETVERAGECDRGAGREVVYELGHAAAFVGRSGGSFIQNSRVRGQIVAGDILRHGGQRRGFGIEAVRQNSDLDAGAIDAKGRARRIGVLSRVRLCGDIPDVRH